MSHPLNIFPRTWSVRDRLARFPRRKATLLPAVWVDELMQQRFGCLMVCGTCAWKYREGLARHAYARHPDMKASGNACDFCKQVYDSMALWFAEEHRYPTRQQYADEQARAGIRGAPHLYDSRRRA